MPAPLRFALVLLAAPGTAPSPREPALLQHLLGLPLAQRRQPADSGRKLHYRGFTVDLSPVDSGAALDAVLAGVRIQIDLVAELGISDSLLRFFRSVPLVMTSERQSGSAAYRDGRVVIPVVSVAPYDRDHPILLHELCHAYHDKLVPGAEKNPELIGFYEAAKRDALFPAGSYMLSDVVEYFGMMASVYLHGSAARDPFTRDAIRTKQPAMYQWLVAHFGAR